VDYGKALVAGTLRRRTSIPARIVVAAVLVVLGLLAGCRQTAEPSADPTSGPLTVTPSQTPEPPTTRPTHTPTSPAPGPTDLAIVYQDGSGKTSRWQLTCDPAGGTHPDPQAACEALAAHGERALPPVPKDVACTEIYGGPDKATVSGTWQGKRVHSTFSRVNGCEISRWDRMRGLLPPGGV
jgi:hypothetical protein